MNYVGNEFAPTPLPLKNDAQAPYPQLMAAPWSEQAPQWSSQFIGSICNLELKNRYADLQADEDDEAEQKPTSNMPAQGNGRLGKLLSPAAVPRLLSPVSVTRSLSPDVSVCPISPDGINRGDETGVTKSLSAMEVGDTDDGALRDDE